MLTASVLTVKTTEGIESNLDNLLAILSRAHSASSLATVCSVVRERQSDRHESDSAWAH